MTLDSSFIKKTALLPVLLDITITLELVLLALLNALSVLQPLFVLPVKEVTFYQGTIAWRPVRLVLFPTTLLLIANPVNFLALIALN